MLTVISRKRRKKKEDLSSHLNGEEVRSFFIAYLTKSRKGTA
jgi:hypothetical protein